MVPTLPILVGALAKNLEGVGGKRPVVGSLGKFLGLEIGAKLAAQGPVVRQLHHNQSAVFVRAHEAARVVPVSIVF